MLRELAELDPVDSPLISVSPDDLAVVVQAIAQNEADVAAALDVPPPLTAPVTNKRICLTTRPMNTA